MRYAVIAVATFAGVAIADDSWNTWSTTAPAKTTGKCSYETKVPVHKCDPEDDKKCWDEEKKTMVWSDDEDDCPKTTDVWNTWATPSPTGQCSYVTEIPVKKCHPKDPKNCWDEKTKSTLWADDCTWSEWLEPTKSNDWNTWATPAITTGKCSYETEVPVKKCHPKYPEKCFEYKTKSMVYSDDCDDEDDEEWADWETWTSPAPTTTASCSYVTEVPVTKCHPKKTSKCYTKTVKSTMYPEDCKTWGEWETTSIPVDPAKTWENVPVDPKKTVTETWSAWETVPAVTTSVVKPEWSKDGWFGPAWTMKDGECGKNIVTSYGKPMWKPTPDAYTKPSVVTKVIEASWSVWSEKPTTTTTTKSVDPTWSVWTEKETSTTKAVVKPSPKPKDDDNKGHAVIKPNGNKWSMTYTPYDKAGKCKTQEVIKKDIKNLAKLGFTSVRVYSTDCKTLEYVGDACEEHGIKIILGVFISKTGIEGAKQQVKDIVAWKKWHLVELIVVGNEAIFQGFCSAAELAKFITECKEEFKWAGYTGSCTTTEPLGEWEKDGAEHLCKVVDVVSANLYAYFNQDCEAEKAGWFIQKQVEELEKICAGKETYVMESGWPSEGQCNGKACPGKDKQKTAIKSIQESCGSKIVFFSFEDELWKKPGQFGVEQHWGCADVFGDVDEDDKKDSWTGY